MKGILKRNVLQMCSQSRKLFEMERTDIYAQKLMGKYLVSISAKMFSFHHNVI